MATTVFTGWRTVTPGACQHCGFAEDWECDGRGTIYCSCECCAECGEYEGHNAGCALAPSEDDCEDAC